MKINVKFYFALMLMFLGCYNPDDDLTSVTELELNLIEPDGGLIADGFSTYNFIVKLPGVKFGKSREVTLKSTWGSWLNDSSSATFRIAYSSLDNSYLDTVRLRAGRVPGPFLLEMTEGADHLKTLDLNSIPQYPSLIQILSDSIRLQLLPGNTANLKALFFNDSGVSSYNTKFHFLSDSPVNIYPSEVFIGSDGASATLQISTDTKLDTIKIYGEIPSLGFLQPTIDTLSIIITN